MISTKHSLLELGIRHLKSGLSITQNNDFNKIIKTAGKNVDANLYINYKNLPNILNTLMKGHYKNEIKDLSNFANFSYKNLKNSIKRGHLATGVAFKYFLNTYTCI